MDQAEEKLAWELVSTEHIVQDEWMDLRRQVYRLPDGKELGPFYNYSRRSYVVIVATDEEGRYLCVRQFRHGIGKVTTEFPAGGIDRDSEVKYFAGGDPTTNEEALETAKRELMEETGYVSDAWEFVMKLHSNASISDNLAYIFRAKNCRREGPQQLDDTEFLSVELHSAQEIEEKIRTGGFELAMHILAWELTK